MAQASYLYTNALVKAFNKEISLTQDSLRVMLCTAEYIPNQDTHIYKSDVLGEIVSPNYSAGGVQITNVTVNVNNETNEITVMANDTEFPSITGEILYAVVYDDTPLNPTAKPLLGYVMFDGIQSVVDSDYVIRWTNGILKFKIY
jgi:20S proteasome alpha/beta subunit